MSKKKQRLDSPSEVLLPELKSKPKGQQTITWPCPYCERNDQFCILETVMQARPAENGYSSRSGRYRCTCTVCEYQTVITSKNPMY